MSKIDLIIDALSIAQNSVWSALNEQALAAARELQAEKDDMYRNPDTGNPCEGWNPSDMAHRSGGLSVEQEPVAWMRDDGTLLFANGNVFAVGQAFYTAPPKREWVGLTDEEISNCWINPVASGTFTKRNVYEAIEAKLKEKNT
jgi:hypothetical protein